MRSAHTRTRKEWHARIHNDFNILGIPLGAEGRRSLPLTFFARDVPSNIYNYLKEVNFSDVFDSASFVESNLIACFSFARCLARLLNEWFSLMFALQHSQLLDVV